MTLPNAPLTRPGGRNAVRRREITNHRGQVDKVGVGKAMKTTRQVIEQSGIDKVLVLAVVRRVGRESLEDVANHGADGGFSGFIYYSETVPFARKHIKSIVKLAEAQAQEFGDKSAADMIAGLRCLNGGFSPDEVGRCLYGRGQGCDDDAKTMIYNALAWYALEEVARAFCD